MAAWGSVYAHPLAQTVSVAASSREARTNEQIRKNADAPVPTRLINGRPLVGDEAVLHSQGPGTQGARGKGPGLRSSSAWELPERWPALLSCMEKRNQWSRYAAVTGVQEG